MLNNWNCLLAVFCGNEEQYEVAMLIIRLSAICPKINQGPNPKDLNVNSHVWNAWKLKWVRT